ncbi:hypothetical protein N7495_002673 [Penicillium taxi]|uniref:uncharacterized protein n=1 Tax=Penicillium taxi TaxID=168475 RepID=UPI00254588C4|nr:uncharacterized protein N7495_002673 [Penicillium taxi]KAJ5902145.1 hypothetical protein N7495_002673 [Penicillium taxi]
MFSASAAIDHLNKRENNTITIYHQTWAIRLLNERLNMDPPALDYAYPLFHAVTDKDVDGIVGQSFGDSPSEGLDKNAALDTEATEGWNRTATWYYKTNHALSRLRIRHAPRLGLSTVGFSSSKFHPPQSHH